MHKYLKMLECDWPLVEQLPSPRRLHSIPKTLYMTRNHTRVPVRPSKTNFDPSEIVTRSEGTREGAKQ